MPARFAARTARKHCVFAAVCLALVLSACGAPALDPIPEHATVLAFGDSLTAGVGAGESESYPAVLARLSGRTVINSGVPGEVTAGGLARLPKTLEEHAPDLLILIEGGNDILRNQDLESTRQNLAAMIELAQARGIQVVLIAVPEKKLFSHAAPLYGELAKRYEVVYDGDLVASLLRRPGYKSDLVHLNATGYRRMAESIERLLAANGAW